MNTSALITMMLVWGVVIYFTVFFFLKILKPKK